MFKKLPLVGRHPFHLVEPSAWPFMIGISFLPLLGNFVDYLHGYSNAIFQYTLFSTMHYFSSTGVFLFILVFSIISWFKDIANEATNKGYHTIRVIKGLRCGMILFITSEIMFFLSFFWAFFHSSVNPSVWIGGVWPPIGIQVLNPWHLPLLNTLILLVSGVTVTLAHRAIIKPMRKSVSNLSLSFRLFQKFGLDKISTREFVLLGLFMTIFYGCLFTVLQKYEYTQTTFSIADSIYGSIFFVATGFHGLHVIIGTIFLIVCFFRQLNYHFMQEYHFGLEAAIWYWHFVDVVWICLFISIYWWGS